MNARIVSLPLLGLCLLLVGANAPTWNSRWPAYDWLLYYSAGRLALAGKNPYDPELQFVEQKAYLPELTEADTVLFYNPPWSLPFFMLVSALPHFDAFRLVWGVLLVTALSVSVAWLSRLRDDLQRLSPVGLALLVCTFLPTLHVVQSGQISPIVLLGLVGFLHSVEKKHDLRAGVWLSLVGCKPHLAVLVWPILAAWAFREGRLRILWAGIATGVVLAGMPCLLNPALLGQYLHTMRTQAPTFVWITPTLGSVLRLLVRASIGADSTTVQLMPILLALPISLAWYVRRRHAWHWPDQLPWLLFGSLLACPYGAWLVDMLVLLVPIVLLSQKLHSAGARQLGLGMGCFYLGCNAVAVAINVQPGHATWHFFWVPLALLAGYGWALHKLRARGGSSSVP